MNKPKQNKSFVIGASILGASTILVKIIGAAFKIPLTNLIGRSGISIFTSAYVIYNLLFILSTAGLPVAISRIVAANVAEGRYDDSKRTMRVAFSTFSVFGLIASILTFVFSSQLSVLIGNPNTGYAIMAIAPAVFLISTVGPIKGYFQGHSDMVPTSVSNIIEALSKLVLGLGIAVFLQSAGYEPSIVAAGAISAISIGTVLSALYSWFIYIRFKAKHGEEFKAKQLLPPKSYKEILGEFLKMAIPVTLAASTMYVANVIDMASVTWRLQTGFGLSLENAEIAYGDYAGIAQTLVNMPVSIIVSIGISIIPMIAAAQVLRKKDQVTEGINSSLKITALLAIPCAVVFILFANPIITTLYGAEGAAQSVLLLAALGTTAFTISFSNTSTSILQGIKKPNIPIISLAIGAVIKVVLNYFLVAQIGIVGATISSNICYLVILMINLFFVHYYLKIRINYFSIIIKPLFAYGVSALIALGMFTLIMRFVTAGRVLSLAILCVCLIISAVFYIIMLLLTKTLDKNDIILLPKGKKLLKILENKGWIV